MEKVQTAAHTIAVNMNALQLSLLLVGFLALTSKASVLKSGKLVSR